MKRNKQLLLFSFAISILFLGLCSRSSPLYPLNNWGDVQIYFTMGRSMTDGLVLYRDVYDHKGPLMYSLFAIASLISRDSFFGVFVMEVITFTAFLYFSAKCAQLYLDNSPVIYGIIALLAPAVTLSTAFVSGSSAEQYCLWTISCSFYLINRALHENRLLHLREAFIIGLCTGYGLYVKFTVLGFFLGLALFVLIWYLLYEKAAKELPAVIGAFFGGILAASVPVFLYFAIHGAVGDFLTGYFYNNLFLYQGEDMSFKDHLVFYYVYMMSTFINNLEFVIVDIIGGAWLLFTPRKNKKFFTAFLLAILFLSISTLGGGRFYTYYTLTFAGFAVYGFIALALGLKKAQAAFPEKMRAFCLKLHNGKVTAAAISALTIVLLCFSYRFSDNTFFMHYQKEDLPQFQFAEYINQKEDPSLLYFGYLDGGFYYTTGITPPCKYIGWINMPLEDNGPIQRQLIDSGSVDFVITRNMEMGSELYSLVASGEMPLEEEAEVFYLYERID